MKHRFITRLDQQGNYRAWWVRFLAGHGSDQSSLSHRTFLDAQYGGKDEALAAAIIYRDDWLLDNPDHLQRHHKAKFAKFHTKRKPSATNESMCVGVSHDARVDRRPCYTVTWRETQPDHTRCARSRTFSYLSGDEDAKKSAYRKAVRLRKLMERTHYTGAINYPKRKKTP